MDYKKLHEETLAALQKMVFDGKITEETARSICSDFIKESEDEKIRKELIGFVKSRGGFKQEHIDWLEKQGTKESKKTSIWKHWKDGIAGNGEGKLIYLIKDGNDYRLSSVLGHECDYVLLSDLDKLMLQEKQGEQKPEIKYIYPKFRVGDVIEPAKPNGSFIPVRVRQISSCSYYCESDDHKAFSSIPICNENEYVLTEQKPAEWSEEDEKLLKLSLENLTELKNRFGEKYGKVGDCIYWLKSIKPQPHWKPSKEQMGALKQWLSEHRYDGDLRHFYGVINSLYEQLKSL